MFAAATLLAMLSGCLLVTVVDSDDRPLPGTALRIASDAPTQLAVVTDVQGQAGWCQVAPREIQIRVDLDGYDGRTVAVRKESFQLAQVQVALGFASPVSDDGQPHRPRGSLLGFQVRVSTWAGKGAIDCGDRWPGAKNSPQLECARTALREGKPFYVLAHLNGVDSQVIVGLASRGRGESRRFDYDDIGGDASDARIEQSPCVAPRIADQDPVLLCR